MIKQDLAEIQIHMATARVSRALRHSVPTVADRNYQPGDKVLARRENVVLNLIAK